MLSTAHTVRCTLPAIAPNGMVATRQMRWQAAVHLFNCIVSTISNIYYNERVVVQPVIVR